MRIRSAIPGTFLSMTASVASGVTSRGESPVPPEVTTSDKSFIARTAKAGFYIGSFVRQNLNCRNIESRFFQNPFRLGPG